MYETILFERTGGVAKIALNRPKKLNAFDATMHDELYAALDEAAGDDEVRCIVLRGEGRGFPAGTEMPQYTVYHRDGGVDLETTRLYRESAEHWDGSYSVNDGQLVTDEDAENIAQAWSGPSPAPPTSLVAPASNMCAASSPTAGAADSPLTDPSDP